MLEVVSAEATIRVEEGDPAARLADIGHELQAALVVIGSRGRGAVTSALPGSVSAGVVRRGGQPVVLVGPRAEAIVPVLTRP